MGKNKVELQYIANDSTRRTTFKNRSRSLIKKVSELATLCGIRTCVVIYEPGEPQPLVWPNLEEARLLMIRLKETPDFFQSRNRPNQAEYLRKRMAKREEKIQRMAQQCDRREMTARMYEALIRNEQGGGGGGSSTQAPAVDASEARAMSNLIAAKMDEIAERMRSLSTKADDAAAKGKAPADAPHAEINAAPSGAGGSGPPVPAEIARLADPAGSNWVGVLLTTKGGYLEDVVNPPKDTRSEWAKLFGY